MPADNKPKSSLRTRADRVRYLRCKNVVVVVEEPDDIINVGTVIRNVNALGADKVYVISSKNAAPSEWQDIRSEAKLNRTSASAVKWTFVKMFEDTQSCLAHLKTGGFTCAVTSPHLKGRTNFVLHEADYTPYKKLAVWFGNERNGLTPLAIEESDFCINIPMSGIIESLNLGTASGIVLYEIGKQRRAFQLRRHEEKQAKKAAAAAAVAVAAPSGMVPP